MAVSRFILALIAVLVLTVLLWPRGFLKSGPGASAHIWFALRWIDSAKQQYAADHGATADTICTPEQLQPYLQRALPTGFWHDGVEYHIGRMRDFPEAVLKRKFDRYPADTLFRLSSNDQEQIILPNTALEPTPTAP